MLKIREIRPEPKSGASTSSATPARSNGGRFGRFHGLRQWPSFGNKAKTTGACGNSVPTTPPTRRSKLVLKVNGAARVLHTRATPDRSFLLEKKAMAGRQLSSRPRFRQRKSDAYIALEFMLADDARIKAAQEKLNSRTLVGDIEDCWLWTGPLDQTGYGRIVLANRVHVGAHRVSYALHHNTHPEQQCVCHTCDTPDCVNPHHLFLGSHAENMADKVAKGRHRMRPMIGNSNPNAQLCSDDVRTIKARIAAGETNTRIARDYPVSHSMISRIRKGKAWSHVV